MINDDKVVLIDFGRAFNYEKYIRYLPQGYTPFHKDLVALRRLIDLIGMYTHCTDKKSDNHKKLMSLCNSETFDEFYKELRKIVI